MSTTEPTVPDLKKEAKALGVKGFSNLDKDGLVAAIEAAKAPRMFTDDEVLEHLKNPNLPRFAVEAFIAEEEKHAAPRGALISAAKQRLEGTLETADPADETTTRSDEQIRADAAAALNTDDGVEHRAVGGTGTVVNSRRASPDADVRRAASRGIYRDLGGKRRVVGAGQPVPDGWVRIESGSLADRTDSVLAEASE